eukprot:NODE_1448_length_1330_cov_18.438071_g1435_i0.p1 GENE.NODE_1448_length_1330_cov_18.438071_g1435_i0~~NODE_1448_length_1330_cov_18.438071_g1435_i0.p1  ORF type:complete len:390 (+),score=32.42 NODE_1448_length_1330_cov_18.438071_g1435_i0:67-1236(+)
MADQLLRTEDYISMIESGLCFQRGALVDEQVTSGATFLFFNTKKSFVHVGKKDFLACKGFKKSSTLIESRRRNESRAAFLFRGQKCLLFLQRYTRDPSPIVCTCFSIRQLDHCDKKGPAQVNPLAGLSPSEAHVYNATWDCDGFLRTYIVHVTENFKSSKKKPLLRVQPCAPLDCQARVAAGHMYQSSGPSMDSTGPTPKPRITSDPIRFDQSLVRQRSDLARQLSTEPLCKVPRQHTDMELHPSVHHPPVSPPPTTVHSDWLFEDNAPKPCPSSEHAQWQPLRFPLDPAWETMASSVADDLFDLDVRSETCAKDCVPMCTDQLSDCSSFRQSTGCVRDQTVWLEPHSTDGMSVSSTDFTQVHAHWAAGSSTPSMCAYAMPDLSPSLLL